MLNLEADATYDIYETEMRLYGDYDSDGYVTIWDIFYLPDEKMNANEAAVQSHFDFDENGTIDEYDLHILRRYFKHGIPPIRHGE